IHDGVRPLVPPWLIGDVIRAAVETGAALPVSPCIATVKEVEGGRVRRTLDRSRLVLAQTPQAFRRSLLVRAHAQAVSQGVYLTDDATMVERLGAPVAVVDGTASNIKVTSVEDMDVVEHLLRSAHPADHGEPR
ncbi:MAG: 2-C-methyl-D-erythritol 4-phosphate cytidylyltransferase, partial [Acidobacteriota bacterium]